MLKRVWAAAGIYFAVFSLLGTDRYIAHRSAQDFGIFYQSIASAFSGFSNTIEGANHFTVHFSPILVLFAPLLWLTHSGLPLVFVQAAANACVAPALYLIARRRVDERAALATASIAFFYPPLWGVTFTDFHENGLVAATIVWLLYALDARNYRLASLFALVALCIKEDQGLFLAVACVAAYRYFRHSGEPGGARWALWTGVFSIAIVVAYFTIVRPHAGAAGAWHPTVFYTVTQPAAVVSPLRGLADRLGYVLLAFAPLAFVPFRSRVLLLAAAPFAEVLLSRAPVTYTMGQHYAAVWIPYVLVAFVLGACDLQNRNPAQARRTLRAAFAICAVILLIANPLHPRYFLRVPQNRDRQLDAFIGTLPKSIDVGTQEEAFTHMGFYRNATLGMERFPQYALFDWNYPDSNWVIRDGTKMRAALAAGRYKVARSSDGIVLYERVGPPPARAPSGPVW